MKTDASERVLNPSNYSTIHPKVRTGADGKPLPQLLVRVLIFDIETDRVIQNYTYNWLDKESQARISRMIIWAVNNHKSVEILSLADDAAENSENGA